MRKIAATAAIIMALGWMSSRVSLAATVYVDVNQGTDQVGCGASPGTGACMTIQYALDNETIVGDTVSLAQGTYNENIIIDKRVILEGAGSSSNPAIDTIINSAAPSTNVIRLNIGGISATERLIIRDLRVTGGTGGPNHGNGINILTGSYVTFDNVASVGNDGNGIAFDPGGAQTDYVVLNCNLSNNPGGTGFRVPTTASIDSLTITGTTMDGNGVIGLSMYGPVTDLNISDSSFDNNGLVGIYGKVNDFAIKKGVVIDNVTANGSGRGIALRIYGGSVTISNTTASDNNRVNPGDIGQGLDLSARDAGCEITLTNVTAENNEDVNIFLETKTGGSITSAIIDNVVVTGSSDEPTAAFCDGCGLWLHTLGTLGTNTISNVSITNSTISGNNRGIVLEAETQPLNNITITDSNILDNVTGAGIMISDNAAAGNQAHNNHIVGNGVGVENHDPDDLFDATNNWWGNATGPYQAVTNPSGLGDEVSDNVTYDPWISGAPTVTTSAVSNVTLTTASSGGIVTNDGGAAVTARGVCWSTSRNPTTANSHTTNGTGTGTFTSSITGLTPGTTYHVRAYAANSIGTSYGNDVTFTTTAATLTISGTVMHGTNPVEGVTITFSDDSHTETTDTDGNYSYTVLYGTSTTVTASKQGYTFTPSEYSYTNLTIDQLNQDFTVLNYVSVTITNPQNGAAVSGAVIITAEVSSDGSSPATASIQSVTKVEFYIDGVLVKQDTRSPYQHRWDTTLASNGDHTIKVKAYHSSGLTGEHEITVNVINSTAPPHIDLNRTRLNFGAIIGESQTGSQTFLIENSGGCCLNWTAAVSDTWIEAAPLSGTANMLVTVSVDVSGLAKGSYTGTVTITDTNADNSPASVDIYLEVIEKAQELPLFGSFDSPVDGSEVFGSVPVTGWALDDVEVSNVKIYRDPLEGHEIGLIYIGDALFVEGARTDIEEKYPGYPKNYQAGWGYMMLTNKLPNNGNGTFVITAVAADSSGNAVTLGSKTITCDNEHAVRPFGAIDTPFRGGDASGMDFVNFGWVLTPQPNTIPTDGSTIKVWVDGVPLAGSPIYNQYREDIATLFPGYNNSDGAVGYYYLDTTLYANGIHTIAWSVQDDAGNSDGVGSRYFRILNVVNKTNALTYHKSNRTDVINPDTSSIPIYLKRGYSVNALPQALYPDKEGIINIVIKEDERIEIGLRDPYKWSVDSRQWSGSYRSSGYLAIGQEHRMLPIGSFLDSLKGIFYWQPGPGYIGEYRFVFIEKNPNGKTSNKQIRVVIIPKFQ